MPDSSTLKSVPNPLLLRLERQVERGLLEAGRALMRIKAEKLYRQTHRSWGAYLEERWGMSIDAADRRIDQARAVEALPTGAPVPSQNSLQRARRALAVEKEQPRPRGGRPTTEVVEARTRELSEATPRVAELSERDKLAKQTAVALRRAREVHLGARYVARQFEGKEARAMARWLSGFAAHFETAVEGEQRATA